MRTDRLGARDHLHVRAVHDNPVHEEPQVVLRQSVIPRQEDRADRALELADAGLGVEVRRPRAKQDDLAERLLKVSPLCLQLDDSLDSQRDGRLVPRFERALPLADAPFDVVLLPLELAAVLCGLLPEDAGLLDDVLEDQAARAGPAEEPPLHHDFNRPGASPSRRACRSESLLADVGYAAEEISRLKGAGIVK
jgi:hypothetical protein